MTTKRQRRNRLRKQKVQHTQRRTSLGRSPIELLEDRRLLAVSDLPHVFAKFSETYPATSSIPIQISEADFTFSGKRSRLGFSVEAIDGSGLDPAAVTIHDDADKPVKAAYSSDDTPGTSSSVVLFDLEVGSYEINVPVEGVGDYVLSVFLAGDIDGNRETTIDDFKAYNDIEREAKSSSALIPSEADANLDGELDSFDLASLVRNFKDSTSINPLELEVVQDPDVVAFDDGTYGTTDTSYSAAGTLTANASLELSFNSAPPTPIATTADGAFTVNVSLTEGSNTLQFTANDSFGQRENQSFEVWLDTIPPQIAIVDPSGPVVDGDNITITGQAIDVGVGVDHLSVTIDAASTIPVAVLADGSFQLTTQFPLDGTADGLHELVFSATDLLGNASQSAPILFELQTASLDPPGVFEITAPSQYVYTATPTISWSESEGADMYDVLIANDFAGTDVVQSATDMVSTSFQASLPAESSYFVFLTARNDNGATVASNTGSSFTFDLTPPTLSAELANDTGTDDQDEITFDSSITGQVSDENSGLVELIATVDGGPIQPVSFDSAGNFFFLPQLAVDGTDDGNHVVDFFATDAAGNTQTFCVPFVLDTSSPVISPFDLSRDSDTGTVGDQQTENEFVNLVGQTAPGLSVQLLLPSQSTTADENGEFQFKGLQLPLGSTEFQVSATDIAGNVGTAPLTIQRLPVTAATVLREAEGRLVERVIPFDVSSDSGGHTLRFSLESTLGARSDGALTGDLLLVSVIDTVSGNTLLGRETLLTLNGSTADFPAGLVRYDAEAVEIDVTELGGASNLGLRLRLLSGEDFTSSIVSVGDVEVLLEPDALARPRFDVEPLVASVGGAADVSGLFVASDIQAEISQLAYDAGSMHLSGQLNVVNNGDPTGRQLFVFFPNLPAGVSLLNPSGFDSLGTPYLNLTPATLSGGLDTGANSLHVPVTFSSDLTGPFELIAEVRSAGPNQAPTLAAIPDLVAPIGSISEIALNATDPDGDLLRYSIRTDTRLPNVELTSNGRLRVNPVPGTEGDYAFTVVVSDGFLTAEQPMNLSVTLDSTANTTVSGLVLDINDNPIPGVPVQIGRFQSTTDATGAFSVELPSFVTPTESFNIPIPAGDPFFDPFGTGSETMELRRAGYDPATGDSTNNPRQHPNLISAFLDGSVVYGSDVARAGALRTLDGTGKLKTSTGELLPFNSPSFFPGGMLENENSSQRDPSELFAAGDVRSNDNVGLMSLHTLMVREHNRRADELAATNPSLTDEELYQQARRWTTAVLQHITYQEYLPLLLGPGAIPVYSGYDAAVDPQISGLFSGAAFRIGHSMSPGELWRLNEDGTPTVDGPVSLGESFFNPDLIVQDGIEPYLLGMGQQPIEAVDTQLRNELRNFLFGPPGAGGLDLISLNIQRGRDLGLPSYNQARVDVGLPAATSFADVTSDTAIQAQLASVYSSVDDLDVIVGGLAEDHPVGSLVGELFGTILTDQFARTRDGDRFWYENEQFTSTDLAAIHGTTLSDLILRNTSISSLAANVFSTGTTVAGPGAGGAAASSTPTETPSFDGTGNNPSNPTIGSARQNLRVDYTLDYGDGVSKPAGSDRPGARAISNAVFDQPSSQLDPSGATTMLMLWGQLLAHDIALTPGGTDDTIKVVGDAAPTTESYPFVAESLPEILQREVYLGVNNELPRPIYLPVIDTSQAVTIDPAVDTTVSVQVRPGVAPVEFTVKAGTAIGQDGQPFTGELSITEVPSDRLPMALPSTLFPEMVVTIQPAGIAFTEPLAVTFPNTAGYEPGQQVDLWSLDPETGKFVIVGKLQTSSDGSVVSTIEGGIQTASWHTPLGAGNPATGGAKMDGCGDCPPNGPFGGGGPPAGTPPESGGLPGETADPPSDIFGMGLVALADGTQANSCGCGAGGPAGGGEGGGLEGEPADLPSDIFGMGLAAPAPIGGGEATTTSNSEVGLLTGALYEQHTTAAYRSLGQARSVQLVYDSRRADPQPVVTFNAQVILGTPGTIWGRVFAVGPDGVTYHSVSDDESGYQVWRRPAGGGTWSSALQLDLSDAPTGVYSYTFQGGNGPGNVAEELIDRFVSVNSQDSPFGAGWGLAGWQYLLENASGTVVIIDGNGIEWLYDRQADGSYTGPPNDFGTLEKLSDGRFRYTSKTQTVNQYNAAGMLETVTDRNGNQTTYQYDATERLSAIIDPVGLTTTLLYTGNKVTEIEDPAGRITRMDYDAAGNLIRVTDPDSTTRSWEYDQRHHMTAETDKRGFIERTYYGFHGRVVSSTRKDGTSMQFLPQQLRALSPPELTSPSDPQVLLEQQDLTAQAVDPSGQVVVTQISQLGGRSEGSTDAIGRLNSLSFNANNLVTSMTNGRGQRTDFTYDDVGNLTSISDTVSLGRAVDAWFFDAFPFGAGVRILAVESVDLNSDGILDIVAVGRENSSNLLFTAEARPGAGFTNVRRYPTTPGTTLAIGDVNLDGTSDVVVAGNETIVFANSGDGSLIEIQRLAGRAINLDITDFDQDGNADLLYDSASSSVGVAYGVGDGMFSAPVQYAFPRQTTRSGRGTADVADLNNDGFDDIVVGRRAGNVVNYAYVLLNQGSQTFAPAVEYFLGPQQSSREVLFSLKLADMESDGNLDLVAWIGWDVDPSLGFGGGELVVMPGVGDGTFGARRVQELEDFQRKGELAVGDLDGNGLLDVILTGYERDPFTSVSTPIVTSALQLQDGTFDLLNKPLSRVSVNAAGATDLADLNGDGTLDLLIDERILRGKGGGEFIEYETIPGFRSTPGIADFNQDGILDAVSRELSSSGSELRLQLSDPNGGYVQTSLDVSSGRGEVGVGDFDGDGNTDFYDPVLREVRFGDGAGQFTAAASNSLSLVPNIVGAVGDYNLDGRTDLVGRATGVTDELAVFFSQGDGTFIESTVSAPHYRFTSSHEFRFESRDLNGDMFPDLLFSASQNATVSIYLNDGAGGLVRTDVLSPFADSGQNVALDNMASGDFDNDGQVEVVALSTFSPRVLRVWDVLPSGEFDESTLVERSINLDRNRSELAVGDFNDDGIEDLAVLDEESAILPGSGDATLFLTAARYSRQAPLGAEAMDADGDGDTDLLLWDGDAISILENIIDGQSAQPWRFEYDSTFNQLTRSTDGIGRTTLYEIDPATGNRLSRTRVVGEIDSPENGESDDVVTSYVYTADGQVDTMTDPLGRVTDYEYDPFGRLTSITYAVGTFDEATEHFEYDPATQAGRVGLVTAQIDENGNRTEYEYDALNRPTKITSADPDASGPLASPVTSFFYDAAGNVITTIDAEDAVMQFEYDELSRRTAATDSLGQTTQFFYDEVGRLTAVVDPLTHVSQATYDARGRVAESIDAKGDSTFFLYDLDNNLIGLTDPVGNRTQFRYDQRDRQLEEVDPLGMRIRYDYDAANQLVMKTDRNDRITEFAYDDLGRLTSETWLASDGSQANAFIYTYDDKNLLSASDQTSSISYTRDFRDRILTESNTGTPNTPDVVLSYTYDDVGNVRSVTDTIDGVLGATTAYEYDGLNRMSQITQSGNATSDKRIDFAYNELGQFVSIDRFSDLSAQNLVVSTGYEYDEINRLLDLRHTNAAATDLAFYEYEYDASSRIRKIASVDGTVNYDYDQTDQLLGSDYSDPTLTDEAYEYDENGNRVDTHLHGTGYVTGEANRLLSDGTYDYEYDDEGNPTLRTEIATGDYREFQWNHRNRLVAVDDFAVDGTPTQSVKFGYDFRNRRMVKSVDLTPTDAVGPAVTHFVNDRNIVILDLVDPDGVGAAVMDQRYLHGPRVDQVLAQEDGAGQVLWQLNDHQGTVRDLSDESGQVANHFTFDTFGELIAQTNPAVASRYRFTGREYDDEIQLQYNRARYYDAALGRFLNEDPIRFESLETNLMRYVGNSVTILTDPSGLCPHDNPETPPQPTPDPYEDEKTSDISKQLTTAAG